MRTPTLLAVALFTVACGKGGIVAAAEKAADTACACADYACAKAATADFNKMSMQASDEKAALAPEDKAKFDAAVSRLDECRNKLKE